MYQNKIREYRKKKGMNLEELARKSWYISRIFMPFRKGVKIKSIYTSYGKNSKSIRKKYSGNFF